MKLRFITSWNYDFNMDDTLSYLDRLKDFNPSKMGTGDGYYTIYINIDTVEQLVKLTDVLGNHIVFGDTEGDAEGSHICIENYNDYRE